MCCFVVVLFLDGRALCHMCCLLLFVDSRVLVVFVVLLFADGRVLVVLVVLLFADGRVLVVLVVLLL